MNPEQVPQALRDPAFEAVINGLKVPRPNSLTNTLLSIAVLQYEIQSDKANGGTGEPYVSKLANLRDTTIFYAEAADLLRTASDTN